MSRPPHTPGNPTYGAQQVRDHFTDVIEQVRMTRTPITVTRHGRPMAVMVDIGWYERARSALQRAQEEAG